MLFDTHLHLDDSKYDDDRDAVLDRARQAGVEWMVSIGTHLDDSAWAVDFAAGRDGVYASVGIHPEMSERWRDEDLAAFEALSTRPKVVAIGEVGLDYHSPGFDKESQHRIFREMIRLSKRRKLPLVIHQRDAAEDTLRILEEEKGAGEGGVFHCFAGDAACAQAVLGLGFDIAVGGILTFPSAKGLREIISRIPLECLVIETDAPWLAPQAQRGKRNEPAFIADVAAKLAELKQVSVDEVERATMKNAKRLFRIPA